MSLLSFSICSLLARRFLCAVFLLLGTASASASDVYIAYDEQGIAQFASQPLDERYHLWFKDLGVTGTLAESMLRPRAEVERALQHAATQHGVDYALLYAVAKAESGFDTNAISPKGAFGLMQIMPNTARRYGVQGTDALTLRDNLKQLHINVGVGGRYLKDLLSLFNGDMELAVAAYNAGEGAVRRSGNRIPPYEETRQYVARVMQTYRHLQSGSERSSTSALGATTGPAQLYLVPSRSMGKAKSRSVQAYYGASQEIRIFEGNFARTEQHKGLQ